MNLYSSSRCCGNCGKEENFIVLINDYQKYCGGKKTLNVNKFELI